MKKSIVSILLILSACTGFAASQTRKGTIIRRNTKTTTVKRTPTAKTVATLKKSAAITTDSGLTYIITQNGKGAALKAGDTVTVNYTGLLTSGVKFNSSLDRAEPFPFLLGAGKVIKGWDEGFQKLRVGDRATFFIPPHLGYGTRGAGGVIPPNATLIFIVEVLGVE